MGLGDQLKQNILQSILSGAAQPTAQLGETNAAAGAAGASAGLSSQETVNAQIQQKVVQAKADQLVVMSQAGDYFKSHTDKNGYVAPKDYNDFLAQFNQKGGDANTFESTFGDRYINPKNALYDTPDAKAARSALPIVKNVIDSYHQLKYTGQLTKDAENLPIIGPYIKQNYLAANVAHDSLLQGEVGNLRAIAGAGPGQGFRFNLQELNNISGLLPKSTDSKQVANNKLSRLNSYMEDNMGISLKSLYGK